MSRPIVEPTLEQVAQAWSLVGDGKWGPFEAGKTAALRFKVARQVAIAVLNAGHVRPLTAPGAPPMHTPEASLVGSHMGSLRVPRHPPMIDRKSAAAGEREE